MGAIAGLAVFIGGLLTATLSGQLADELKAWTPWLIERLIRRAVLRLPENRRVRFDEEWRSHVNEVPGEIGKLVVAVGCSSAARKMSAVLDGRSREGLFASGLKRVFDIGFSSLGMVLLAPSFAVLTILIRLDSRGPVMYGFPRVGLNGRRFRMYRLRTTKTNPIVEGDTDFTWQERIRTTRIGVWLRRSALDQLPLLMNVLLGEMSLIGPRPECPEWTEVYCQSVPRFEERLKIKPGIVGWAKVNCASDIRQELAYDLYYAANRSSRLDLLILARALALTFRGRA